MKPVMMATKSTLTAVPRSVSKRTNGNAQELDPGVVNLFVEMGSELGLNNVMTII